LLLPLRLSKEDGTTNGVRRGSMRLDWLGTCCFSARSLAGIQSDAQSS
jgi:hypothetical protein